MEKNLILRAVKVIVSFLSCRAFMVLFATTQEQLEELGITGKVGNALATWSVHDFE